MDTLTRLPPPRPRGGRIERFTIHLNEESARKLRELAEARREPPGRVATLLVEAGVSG